MRICMIGAGSMGSLYGALLARSGNEIAFIDRWQSHVDAIRRHGLRLDGLSGDVRIEAPAQTDGAGLGLFDLAIILVDANATCEAARTAKSLLKPDGYALTLQNGIGNVEALVDELGASRVMGGLSYHSAAVVGPGHVTHTHRGPTWIGEIDKARTSRLQTLNHELDKAGLNPVLVDDIIQHIWNKFVLNSSVNAIAAITGLRLGEVARNPAVDQFQTKIIDEIIAVMRAKGIELLDADPKKVVKDHCWHKYNKPSMLQHIEAGKRTEIDALNGAVVREAKAFGIPVPYNESLTLLIKGLEQHRRQILHEPPIDYEALEAAVLPR